MGFKDYIKEEVEDTKCKIHHTRLIISGIIKGRDTTKVSLLCPVCNKVHNTYILNNIIKCEEDLTIIGEAI